MNVTRAFIVAVFAIGFTLGGCDESQRASKESSKTFGAAADVTAYEAKALLDADKAVKYLDVRTVKEFEESRPAGAWNIPFLMFDENGERAKNPDFLAVVAANFKKSDRLVLGCKSGGRSKMAHGVLQEAGYVNVVNMLGGFSGKRSAGGTLTHEGWSQLKLPTESGPGGATGYQVMKSKTGL